MNVITRNVIGIEMRKKGEVLKDNMKNCETRYDDVKGEKFSENERT
jgi:hypothetical protein